jgi:hypothetical protein
MINLDSKFWSVTNSSIVEACLMGNVKVLLSIEKKVSFNNGS